jgi:hypothetical protein
MEQLLARLERRIGRFAIHNLIGLIVGGMALVWVLSHFKPEFQDQLVLDMGAVRRGQFWRVVTFLFIPPPSSALWLLVNLYFTWWVGSSLERQWGAFRFNAYYGLGAFLTVLSAVVMGSATNFWLDTSLFLALASLFPDEQIQLYFFIPIRAKWLGFAAFLYMLYVAATSSWPMRGAIAVALANYLLFFTGQWIAVFKNRGTMSRQKARRDSMRAPPPGAEGARAEAPDATPVFGQRVCAMCGARESEGTDIRVCSCDKCGGVQRALCLAHARNH